MLLQPEKLLLVCVALGLHAPIYAAPDAGSLQPRAGGEPFPPLPRPAPKGQAKPQPESADETQPAITVTGFHLDGDPLITDAQFLAAVAPFLNRPLDYEKLRMAARAVASAYRQAGWVVDATLPEQDVSDGMVRILVTPAIFGGVDVAGAQANPPGAAAVAGYVTAQQAPMAALRSDALERAVLLINDLPGVGATGILRPGQYSGETDLLVQLATTKESDTNLSLDNAGARSTGYQRALASWSKPGVLTWGDQFSASLTHTFTGYQSDGSDYQRMEYSLPIGYAGWRLALGGGIFSYRLVSPEYAGLGFQGDSDAWDVELTYPLIRRENHNLSLVGRVEQKHFDNEGAGITVSRYRVEEQSWGLRGNMFDETGGGATTAASLLVSSGYLDLRDSPTESSDATTTATNGTFTRLRYSLSRDQWLGHGVSLFAAVNGQTADKNLDSSEKFYLGGINGVRAYPASEGSGYQGFVLNLEARWRPAANWQLTALYDYGYVTVNHDNSYSGASSLNDYALRGYGLSAAWRGERNQSLALIWARRIGDNANATSAGNDQDGTYYRDRFLLTGKVAF